MAKANKSRYAVLGILVNAPGSSGYDVQAIMKRSTDFFWKETFSSIYPVLDALLKEKLVEKIQDSLGGRKRNTYRVTKKGLTALQSWLMEEVELEQSRNELLLKMLFGELSPISSSIKHIETYKQQVLAKKLLLNETQKRLLKEHVHDPGLPFWLLTVEFGLRRMDASIAWAEYALGKLLKMEKMNK